jgi:hypothetical protein
MNQSRPKDPTVQERLIYRKKEKEKGQPVVF